MLRLSAAQTKTKHALEASLAHDAEEIRKEIQVINGCLSRLEQLADHYNERVEAANTFRESVHEAQGNYMDSRSDAWADSDRGDMYRDWADSWSEELEALELELPDPLDEPDLLAVDAFQDLPALP